jgi:hypothetical protein
MELAMPIQKPKATSETPVMAEITRNRLSNTINAVGDSDAFWELLLEKSEAQSGPFDGGCLIIAKAIILVAGGSLVRVVSDVNGGQTEHYGALVEGVIFDFDGPTNNSDEWLARFKRNEYIVDRSLSLGHGYDGSSEIPDDPFTSKELSKMLMD